MACFEALLGRIRKREVVEVAVRAVLVVLFLLFPVTSDGAAHTYQFFHCMLEFLNINIVTFPLLYRSLFLDLSGSRMTSNPSGHLIASSSPSTSKFRGHSVSKLFGGELSGGLCSSPRGSLTITVSRVLTSPHLTSPNHFRCVFFAKRTYKPRYYHKTFCGLLTHLSQPLIPSVTVSQTTMTDDLDAELLLAGKELDKVSYNNGWHVL